MILFAVFFAVFAASLVRTSAGFGFSLIAVPFLGLFIGMSNAVVLAGLMTMSLSLWSAGRDINYIDWKIALISISGGLIGVPFGILALIFLADQSLSIIVCMIVFFCLVLVVFRLPLKGGMKGLAAISAISGASFAATGIDGPPMVAAMQGLRLQPRTQRSILGVVFAVTSTTSVCGYAFTGQIHASSFQYLMVSIPALLLGIAVGEWVFSRLSQESLRKYIVFILLVSFSSALSSVIW